MTHSRCLLPNSTIQKKKKKKKKMKFLDFSLTFLIFEISLTSLQNSLTFPWQWRKFKFPWLFPDQWPPCLIVSVLDHCLSFHFSCKHVNKVLTFVAKECSKTYYCGPYCFRVICFETILTWRTFSRETFVIKLSEQVFACADTFACFYGNYCCSNVALFYAWWRQRVDVLGFFRNLT